jgi:hypothetical protein
MRKQEPRPGIVRVSFIAQTLRTPYDASRDRPYDVLNVASAPLVVPTELVAEMR